ncbi:MAG TPA: FAD-dependent oxidoreductase, partial [Candidatus Paceibacterota bacterium]|nr:FAD-dependent oxidoreductase [Candidatus Paceibacterota bacterium]
NTKVKEVHRDEIILDDNTRMLTETIIWVAGVKPAELVFDVPVAKSPDGRLIVNKYLQLEQYKEIFAIGDVASFTQNNSPLPALAQVAEKEAKAAAKNIELLIKNEALKEFSYHHAGNLISLGRWMAIGEVLNFTFWGGITWWVWRTVYLSKLISTRKKIRVAIDWTMNIFSSRDISQI